MPIYASRSQHILSHCLILISLSLHLDKTYKMKYLLAFLTTITAAFAADRTSAPSGCLTVGSGGQFSTIQSAVDSLSTSSSSAQCIFIQPGTYSEQVLVSARKAQLTVYGFTKDTTTYSANQVTITGSLSQADGLSNDETATLRVKATNFKLYNVNVANTYGKGSQAVALSAYADSGYYACAFTGYQDTLLAQTGNQLYSGCMISGVTDFIFGQNAPAWFEKCDIRVLSAKMGYITGKRASQYYVSCVPMYNMTTWEWKTNDRRHSQPMAARAHPAHLTTSSTSATSRLRATIMLKTRHSTWAGRGATSLAWFSSVLP